MHVEAGCQLALLGYAKAAHASQIMKVQYDAASSAQKRGETLVRVGSTGAMKTLNYAYVLGPFHRLLANCQTNVLMGIRLVQRIDAFAEPTPEDRCSSPLTSTILIPVLPITMRLT
jgi:hypothetical protein